MTRRQQLERAHLQIGPNGSNYSLIAGQTHVSALRDLFRKANVPVREEEIDLAGVIETCFNIDKEHIAAAQAVLDQYQRAE